MKQLIKIPALLLLISLFMTSSCKKDELSGTGTVESEDYIFNAALKSFDPGQLHAEISAPEGIRFIYTYLIRSIGVDSLVSIVDLSADKPTNYTFSLEPATLPINNMSTVRGIKILVKQGDNSTVSGMINIDYYDPAKPFLQNFPLSIDADITGGTTAVTGNISSETGLVQIDIYDDYKSENSYDLVHSVTDLNNTKDYNFNYAYTYRKASQHLKVVAKDIFGQTSEMIMSMPVDISNFIPKFLNFSASITPNLTGATPVLGKITSITGLKQIDIYDDYQGSYVLVSSLTGLNNSKDYAFNYDYTFRNRAAHLKIVAIDNDDLQAEKVIDLVNITYSSNLYRNVNMMAQGNASTTSTSSFFIAETGTVLGNCELVANEGNMSFLFYGTSTGPSFYSPTNTANVAANFRCDGVSWVRANPSSMKATRFRVLVPGTTDIDNIYAKVEAGTVDLLDDSFFTGISVPGSSSSRYDPAVTATASIFNTTTAYLIWARIPQSNGSFTNALIRVKEVVVPASTALSTINFDVYVQK